MSWDGRELLDEGQVLHAGTGAEAAKIYRVVQRADHGICWNSLWKDFCPFHLDRLLAEFGHDGWYPNGPEWLMACNTPWHGCGYRAPNARKWCPRLAELPPPAAQLVAECFVHARRQDNQRNAVRFGCGVRRMPATAARGRMNSRASAPVVQSGGWRGKACSIQRRPS